MTLFSSSYFNADKTEQVSARLEALERMMIGWHEAELAPKSICISWELIDDQVVPNLDVEFQNIAKTVIPK